MKKITPPFFVSYMKAAAVFFMLIFLFITPIWSQKTVKPHPDAVNIALNYLAQQQKKGELTEADVQNAIVEDHYADDFNGVTHVYIIQKHAGIELYNALCNVSVLASGEVLYVGNRFVKDVASMVNTTTPNLSAAKAVQKAFVNLGLPENTPLSIIGKNSANEVYFDKGAAVLSDIHVQLVFQKINDKSARLAWNMNIDQLDGHHLWQMRIDAVTGQVLEKNNLSVSCNFQPDSYKRLLKGDEIEAPQVICAENNTPLAPSALDFMPPLSVANSYRVFPFPAESPLTGTHTLVTNPADATASPFGWHDTNGAAGAEYTITRGNNVHAYLDVAQGNKSVNDEPNGGADLNFDFPYIATGEPDTNKKAAVVNLFYVNNMMHDLSHYYGFTEVAGNFQQTNYTGAAGGGDYVQAEALDGKDASTNVLLCPTGCANNANFSTLADGTKPRMQMYIWQELSAKNLTVVAPNNLAGKIETAIADFGKQVSATPVTGDVVVVNDGSANPTLGCGALTNTNLTGKIALIDRGTCTFAQKAINAQAKGAIGVIICNVDNALNIRMTADPALAAQVTIPLILITKNDGDRIRSAPGLRVSIVNSGGSGPTLLDGDFDNGIIAHEYTHGISNRLTGGRLRSDCLSAGENQSGEGWSDFLALAFTAKPSDRGTTQRPVGTYAMRSPTGVRDYAYSTDKAVNPLTYDDLIIQSEVHQAGAIWCTALWDMYWAMVDLYGFDANMKNVNSGNGKAVRLVMDAMKIQPCNPGFLEARDAVLAADRADFGGENQCLIWDAFAKRGMGYNAAQGTSTSKADNTEGYEKYPFCVKQLKITKKATPIIKAGDQITYTIQVINHKGVAATNVVVSDELPTGLTYIAGSANRAVTQNGAILSFNIANMNDKDTVTISYKAASDPSKKSITSFYDDMERGDANWDLDIPGGNLSADNLWEITTGFAKSGIKAFSVKYPTSNMRTDQVLFTKVKQQISGRQPVLRFWHVFDTQAGFDGGIVQVSTDNGANWRDIGDKFFKNPYRGKIEYSAFSIPNAKAWWGQSGQNPATWIDSYADLSAYTGQSVQFRFRYATDSLVRSQGWFVDDVTVMDMVNYNSRARLTSAQGDTASAEIAERGTIVDPAAFTPTKEITEGAFQMRVFPNPANNLLNINVLGSEKTAAALTILSTDGRLMWSKAVNLAGNKEEVLPIDISAFPSGIYFVKISTDNKVLVEKVVKH
jgi:uncharacterized repeat protein (TIGR01451 family)